MSLWWLLLLWPLSGYIGWAWFNYMVWKTFGGDASPSVRWYARAMSLLGGPLSILVTVIEMSDLPRENRWGLRF